MCLGYAEDLQSQLSFMGKADTRMEKAFISPGTWPRAPSRPSFDLSMLYVHFTSYVSMDFARTKTGKRIILSFEKNNFSYVIDTVACNIS